MTIDVGSVRKAPVARPILLGIGATLLVYLSWRMVRPFLPAVCWALALAVIVEPLRVRLLRRSVPLNVSALVLVGVVLAAVIGPGVVLVRALAG